MKFEPSGTSLCEADTASRSGRATSVANIRGSVSGRTTTSPSTKAMISPRASSAPRLRAYAGPDARPFSLTTVSAYRAAIPTEASELASSTTMTSYEARGSSLPRIAANTAPRVDPESWIGTTTDSGKECDIMARLCRTSTSPGRPSSRANGGTAQQGDDVTRSPFHGKLTKILCTRSRRGQQNLEVSDSPL